MKRQKWTLPLAGVLLAVGMAAGGTLAWLLAESDTVTNTFTTSDITVTLHETTGTTYKMVPGYTLAKDPKVTVTQGSEKCYVFVTLEKSENFDEFLTYEMAEGWTLLAEETDVFYRVVDTADMGSTISVLKDDCVSVLETVTKEAMNDLPEESQPTLTVTAYAAQYNKNATEFFTAAEAWTLLSKDSTF